MPVPLSVSSGVLNTRPAPLESRSKCCQGPTISSWYSSSPYMPRASDCKAHLTLCLRNRLDLGRGQCQQIGVVDKYLASLGSRVEQDSVQQDWVPSVSGCRVLISTLEAFPSVSNSPTPLLCFLDHLPDRPVALKFLSWVCFWGNSTYDRSHPCVPCTWVMSRSSVRERTVQNMWIS